MSTRRNLLYAAAMAGSLLAASYLIPVTAGAGAVAGEWTADARASAVDMGAVTTGGFIVDRFDPSAALATSHLETGTEVATSLASAPYPSEIGEQFPGLLYGVLQNTLPYNGIPVPALGTAPSWPFTVRSSANGTDPPSASAGGDTSPMSLKTKSEGRTTTASAATGGSGPNGFSMLRFSAESSADAAESGKAAVKAVSTVANLVIGDALKVGKIRTELAITQTTGGKPAVAVKRTVEGLSIGGVAAELSPEGFVVQGTKTPLPQPALDALKAAGISVLVGEQRDTVKGVTASGLVIRRAFDFSQMSGGQLPLSVPKTMVMEMAFAVATGDINDLTVSGDGDGEAASPPEARLAMRLVADSAPVGGGQPKKELGAIGVVAEIAAIAFVLLLVIGRGRRVVGRA